MKKIAVVLAAVFLLSIVVPGFVFAGGQTPPIAAYNVPGNPRYIAAESPSRIWFTIPDQNLIGRLVVTSTVDYNVVTYPTTISEPHDIVFAGGFVWYSGRSDSAIGRMNPVNGNTATFPISNPNSQLAGISVLAGSPTRVWIADEGAGALVQLVITDTLNYQVIEYPLPVSQFGADPQLSDVHAVGADNIWFAAPGSGSIGYFRPSVYLWGPDRAFTRRSTGAGSAPVAIHVDRQGNPWFVEQAGNRVGKFFPQTLSDFDWYQIPLPSSGLYDIVTGSGYVWFTESAAARVGRIDPVSRRRLTFALPGSQPGGLGIDADGVVWIADSSGSRIFGWRAPYFYRTYLPLIMRQF
jgi:virginiamycin B lyase